MSSGKIVKMCIGFIFNSWKNFLKVINAARILSSRPKSKVAQENMEVFKTCWEQQLLIITDAVDDIVTVEDFLSVSENHILEDVNR